MKNSTAISINPSNETDNTPNAAKLLSSLRQLDYSSSSAICDIVDNSIDAGADVIRISLIGEGKKNVQRIEIWDNGFGMDSQTLNQAMRLGSDTQKNPQYDLGRYGMGLVTASISIGERLEVISRKDGLTHGAVQDLDRIRETNRFVMQLEMLKASEAKDFYNSLQLQVPKFDKDSKPVPVENGTVVIIEKIDRWQWIQISASERHLAETLGQVFRKFIKAGRKIFINDTEVKPIDPIHDHAPQLLAEDYIAVEGEKIEIKLYEIVDEGRQINDHKGRNITNQGFYVLRNNREIATGLSFGLWTKHGDFNFFRAELSYPGSLDEIVNAGFTKQNINPKINQSVYDKLKALVSPHLKQIKNRAKKRQEDNREKKEDYSDIEKYITQKAHLLKTPQASIEKRDPKVNESKTKAPPASASGPRLDITKRKHVDLSSLKVSFRTKSLDKAGVLYIAEMEKDVTVIYWNVDHPFYVDFIIPHEEDKDVLNPICFLIYSLASAELRSKVNSDSEDIIENIRADLSQNLRVLMNS